MLKRFIPKPAALGAALLVCAIHATALGDGPSDATTPKPKASDEAAQKRAAAEKKLHESYWARLNEAFAEQLGTPCFVPPTPTPAPSADGKSAAKETTPATCERRGLPVPFDGPPYPTGEWQLGGTNMIGDSGVIAAGPVMQAFYDGPSGAAIKDSRVQLYGWEDFSGNVSSSHIGPQSNFPEAYDLRGNRMEQNQFVLYLERVPDECQTDHMDWGFRLSGVYGLDYRYMISRGFVSNQLIKKGDYDGYDFPMMYYDLYVPNVAMGMNIRIGRMISAADIEAQLAPNNLMSSHSLLYEIDPYTQWGMLATVKLDPQWTIQAGISAGNDVAPWVSDPGRQATGTVMIQWISKDNKDSIYGGANSFNNAGFGYNNLQMFVETWTHKFTEKIWTSWETWYMYQEHATTAPTAEVPYQNGSFPVRPGYAAEFATLDYTMFRMAANTFFTVRNEFLNDMDGNRTGYATKYSEHSIGITWWPNELLTIRPELRFDHSYADRAYDAGTRKNQLSAQCDVVIHF